MKILFISDLHFVMYQDWQNFLKINKNKFDIIISLGDMDIMFLKSLMNNFSEKKIFGVLGNHDYPGDLEYLNIPNLNRKYIRFEDVSLVGVEGCVKYKNERDTPIHTQEEIIRICEDLEKADIVVSHNSPYGIHDKPGIAHEGYVGLMNYIERHNPKFVVHGHQHKFNVSTYNNTTIICTYGALILDFESGEIERVLYIEE